MPPLERAPKIKLFSYIKCSPEPSGSQVSDFLQNLADHKLVTFQKRELARFRTKTMYFFII